MQSTRTTARGIGLLDAMGNRLGMPLSISARLSVQSIEERMAELHDKATALTKLAEKESRDLSDEETEEFDGYMAEYNRLKTKDLPRAEFLENEERHLAEVRVRQRAGDGDANNRAGRLGTDGAAGDGTDLEIARSELVDKIKVPTRARLLAPAQLRCFHGPTAVEEAYISGMWLLANFYGNENAAKWCQDNGLSVRNALSTSDSKLGGVLVPPEFSMAIIRLVEQYGVFRQKAFPWPMASDTTSVPRQIGEVTAYFTGENQATTASDPSLDNISLTARKLSALCKWPTEIDEDAAIQIADLLARSIAYAFALKEDQCGFLGTGASTYGQISGLITECAAATATVVTAATANTAFSTLDLTDFEAMIGKLPEFPGIQPEWYISKPGWAASMGRLADAAGGNTAEDIEGRRRLMFLGFPVNIVQVMNSTLTAQTSTNGLCYFGDLRMAAMMGTRRALRLKISDQRYFEYDQMGILGTERIDINVHDVGDTSNAGAMIMLATPSS